MAPATFEELYNRYSKDVYRYALWLTANAAEAEEIASSVFFRAWTAEPLRESTAKSYLLAIARNLFVDGRRKERRLTSLPGPGTLRAATADPELQAQVQQLWAMLQALEPQYRDPLTLWAGGGLSYEEIAHELHLPAATVTTRIHRARMQLAAGRLHNQRK